MAEIKEVKRRGKAKEAIIESKDQRWHCRNRISLVFGSNDPEDLLTHMYDGDQVAFKTIKFHQAKSKAIEEIFDNCIDEFYRGHVTEIHASLDPDGKTITIADNGIGFPLPKIVPVYSEFRTGSKFRDEETDSKGFLFRTLGQNGLGASATCLTSDFFEATVRHYNSKKEQTVTFLDGALTLKKEKIKSFTGPSGVKVTFSLAKEVYKNVEVDVDLFRKRIIDLASINPGLTFYFAGERFCYEKGLFDLATRVDASSAQVLGNEYSIFEGVNEKGKAFKGRIDMHVSVCFNKDSDERERVIAFANSSPTYDGGFHVDKIRRSFVNAIKEKLERESKKDKFQVSDNDVLSGMTFIIGITMPNPRFESQTKRKLVRDPNLEKALEQFMEKNMDKFLKRNREVLDFILERARTRQRFQDLKEASKQAKQSKKQRVDKLLDANERRDRSNCTLFICEGDSAIGGLRSARDKLLHGGIALRGKPLNVSQCSIQDILKNQEFSDIMASVGLTLGSPVDFEQLRYSKIVFLADSDVDGGHINTLLTNFFFAYWPELFEQKRVKIAKAPLFEIVTDKEVFYAETPEELERMKKKIPAIKEIHRNKGLGEMSPEAWKYVMKKGDYTTITVADMTACREMLDVCFGKDTIKRKDLLMDAPATNETPAADRLPARKIRDEKPVKEVKKVVDKTVKKGKRLNVSTPGAQMSFLDEVIPEESLKLE